MAEVVRIHEQPPPCDLDAEGAMLSAILNDQTKYDDVISVAHPEMCYSDANRRVFDAIAELREAGKPLDVVTVAHTLNAAGRLAQIGGTQYLAQLIDAVPHVANVVEYATIVREQWRLRQAMARAQVVIATIRAGKIASDDVQAVLEEAETAFGLIAHQQQSKFLVPIKESLDEACQALRLMIERGETITGTPILFKPLDEAMSGLHEGDLYIVAGRPGMGKTAFAMGIGENVAKQDEGVAVFSLEMPDSQLVTRMLASHTRIDVTTFRKPRELADKWAEIVVALGEMEKLPIWIDDTGGISISEIRARVRKLKSDIAHNRVGDVKCKRLRLVIVDYMQLVSGTRGNNQNREQEIAFISRSLKLLAKQESVAVIALSQLNRNTESRKGTDKRPQLADLRESGAIEQDADAVLFVYRPSLYSDEPEFEGIAEIIIGKQRQGPTGIHRLAFEDKCVRFSLLERNEFDEYDGFEDK